ASGRAVNTNRAPVKTGRLAELQQDIRLTTGRPYQDRAIAEIMGDIQPKAKCLRRESENPLMYPQNATLTSCWVCQSRC
ncbi:hypothetical protein, partial [Paracoccus sp. JM45]|uniref:hypothetical protein n=1 Tax=Paracoccus sp. JM45 TaxID=2283626 RepID=UPI001C725907